MHHGPRRLPVLLIVILRDEQNALKRVIVYDRREATGRSCTL